MISTTELTEKVFTIRDPSYTKVTSPKIIAAEKRINKFLKRKDVESTATPNNDGEILVLFIHGFAASKYCWLDPDIGNMGWVKDYKNDPEPIDFGWHALPPPPYIPVAWTMSEQLVPIGATQIMDKNGIEWLTYSQESAFGDIEVSVKELDTVLKAIKEIYGNRRIIIIAHSQGGLLSKRYLDIAEKTNIEKLVTFGTPYGGSFMSAFELFRLPSKHFLNRVKTARKLWDVSQERKVESIATKQLAPDSDFLNELSASGCRDDVKYVNVAGTSSLISYIYAWRWKTSSLKPKYKIAKQKMNERKKLIDQKQPIIDWYNLPSNYLLHPFNWLLEARKIMQIYPKIGYHEVLQGDGAVSIKSALMSNEEVKHYIIDKNHVDMTCSKPGYEIMIREVNESINDK
ncbi:MAG: hypothetical protein HZR80_15915 [Candidatus Heimdallarchaeota archaeon]